MLAHTLWTTLTYDLVSACGSPPLPSFAFLCEKVDRCLQKNRSEAEARAWLPVVDPQTKTPFVGDRGCVSEGRHHPVLDVLEIGSAENKDDATGKQGSVCDVRASLKKKTNTSDDAEGSNDTCPMEATFSKETDKGCSLMLSNNPSHTNKRKQIRKQFHVLEDLLRESVPPAGSGSTAEKRCFV